MNIECIQKHINDNRSQAHISYSLESLVFIIFSAVLSGYYSSREISEFAKVKFDWISKHVELDSPPCRETLRTALCMIAPQALINAFSEFIESNRTKHIAIDGKTMRATAHSSESALHILSAWCSTNGITLSALLSEGKKNEIKSIPKLIQILGCTDTVITIDAMGCQKSIALEIIKTKNDYILQIKANQKKLKEQILAFYQICWRQNFTNVKYSTYQEIDKGHGRIELRKYEHFELSEWIDDLDDWNMLKSAIKVTRTRIIRDKETTEESWFISSLLVSQEHSVARFIRQHWSIENSLHWRLDVMFKDDRCLYTDEPALNISLIKRHCMNLLTKAEIGTKSMKAKIMRVALSDDVREKVLFG